MRRKDGRRTPLCAEENLPLHGHVAALAVCLAHQNRCGQRALQLVYGAREEPPKEGGDGYKKHQQNDEHARAHDPRANGAAQTDCRMGPRVSARKGDDSEMTKTEHSITLTIEELCGLLVVDHVFIEEKRWARSQVTVPAKKGANNDE